jgi:hypothetical protein
MRLKHKIPNWVGRGKTVKQLIEELKTFENQNLEVRISLDYGDTHHPISIVQKDGAKYCVLVNAEAYHADGWQKFMDEVILEKKSNARRRNKKKKDA